jgi:hypothetical protein
MRASQDRCIAKSRHRLEIIHETSLAREQRLVLKTLDASADPFF